LFRRNTLADLTLIFAAGGGALIGLASTVLMLLTGRIAGISGIFAGCLRPSLDDGNWRIAFIAGLILAPLAARVLGYPVPSPQMPVRWIIIVVAGLLVGFGTRMRGGCTSGHGICGIARLSARSLAATAIFMVTAIVVVALSRHLIGG
jgi:uncharacterized protein